MYDQEGYVNEWTAAAAKGKIDGKRPLWWDTGLPQDIEAKPQHMPLIFQQRTIMLKLWLCLVKSNVQVSNDKTMSSTEKTPHYLFIYFNFFFNMPGF